MSDSTCAILGSAKTTAAKADASTTLSVTVFADHANGIGRRLQARRTNLSGELLDRELWRRSRLIYECEQLALQRTVIDLGAPFEQLHLLCRNIFYREVDTHRVDSICFHIGAEMVSNCNHIVLELLLTTSPE